MLLSGDSHYGQSIVPDAPTDNNETEVRVVRSILKAVPLDPLLERKRIAVDRYAPVWLIAEPSSLTAKISQQFDASGCKPQFIPWNDSPYAYEPKGLAGLVMIAPEGPMPDDLVLRAFRWMKRASAGLNESARNGGSFFTTVTKLDGWFGLGDLETNRDPGQGAFAGLCKTASHEWPKVACKCIDLDPGFTRNLAPVLVDEILAAGPLEVGINSRGKISIEIEEAEAVLPAGEEPLFHEGDVVVVDGRRAWGHVRKLVPHGPRIETDLGPVGSYPDPGTRTRLAFEAFG